MAQQFEFAYDLNEVITYIRANQCYIPIYVYTNGHSVHNGHNEFNNNKKSKYRFIVYLFELRKFANDNDYELSPWYYNQDNFNNIVGCSYDDTKICYCFGLLKFDRIEFIKQFKLCLQQILRLDDCLRHNTFYTLSFFCIINLIL